MTIKPGTTYFYPKTDKLSQEEKIKISIEKFTEKHGKQPTTLYVHPDMSILHFPTLTIVNTKMILPNNYHLSAE